METASWVSKPGETNGPLMSITGWSITGFSAIFLCLRLVIRQHKGKIWLDDWAIGISWVLLLIQVILNQLAINLGYGKHTLDINLKHFITIQYYVQAELTLSVIAITLSKISFGITLLRLTDGWVKRYVYFAIATLAIFAIPACVILWIQCAAPMVNQAKCLNMKASVAYGQFQAIWSAVMDVSLALLPWKIIWNLQMRLAEKIGVGIAMSLGLLAGATAIVRSMYIEQLATQDLSYDSYNAIIWSFAESAMAIVATSIPVLRVIFKQAINSAISGYNSSNPSKGSKAGKSASNNGLSRERAGMGQSSKRTAHISISEGSSKDVFGRGPKDYIELDDVVIDEGSGRVTTTSFTDILPNEPERNTLNRHV